MKKVVIKETDYEDVQYLKVAQAAVHMAHVKVFDVRTRTKSTKKLKLTKISKHLCLCMDMLKELVEKYE